MDSFAFMIVFCNCESVLVVQEFPSYRAKAILFFFVISGVGFITPGLFSLRPG